MSVIASLMVNVSGRTTAFDKAMAGARKQVQGLAAGVSRAAAMPGAALGVMSAVAGSAFGVAVKGSMAAADAAAKQSDQIGMATERLIGLQHAGDLAGVSADDVAKNLRKMQVNLAKVADGAGGPAAAALDRMGLSAASLIQMGPDAAVKAIADGLLGIEDPAHRAQAATALFGKEGAAMVSMLAGGSAGLAEAQREAELFGVAVTRVDAAKIEAANDAATRVSTAFKGLATQVGVGLAPFLDLAAQKMQQLLTSGGGAAAVVRDGFGAGIAVLGVFADGVELVQIAFLAVRGAVQKLQSFAVSALLTIAQGIQKVAAFAGFDGFGQGVVDFLDAMQRGLAGGAAEDFSKVQEKMAGQSASSRLKGWFEEVTNGADAAARSAGELNQSLSEVGDFTATNVTEELAKLEEKLRDKIDVARLGETGAELKKLEGKGASSSDLDRIRGLDATAQAEEFAKKLADPLEMFEKRLADLDRLASVGAIDERTLALGKAQAADEAAKALDTKKADDRNRLNEGITRGSAAAANAELKHLFNSSGENEQLRVARETLAAQKAQLVEQRKSAAALSALAANVTEV